jgi:predicted nucleic acid-binding protein
VTTFPALLDTNVLYGAYLNDVLLSLAERGLFRPLWSDDILVELERNLLENGEDPALVEKRVSTMRTFFPDAVVSGYSSLLDNLTCHAKDRHVLAAAIRANAEVLVTFNIRDFPADSVAAYDIEVVSPDRFLLDQLDLYPGATVGTLRQLVADYSRPELSIDDLLVILAGAGVPEFARAVGPHL